MATRTLRAVTPNEKPRRRAKKAVATVTQAVANGTSRDQLVAMRARIAKAIDDPNIRGADLASLSRRLLEIGKEIEALDAAAKQEAAEDGPTPDEDFDASAV
jgi:hypothetical protein